MRNQASAYMIQREKMSCICLYANPIKKYYLDSGSFKQKKKRIKENHDMFSTVAENS